MDEMRVGDGVKESSKKKLVRSTWVGHMEKWEMKNGKDSEEDRHCNGGLR